MTISQLLYLLIGAAFGLFGGRISDFLRGRDTVHSLQRDNAKLESENSSLRQKLADCLKTEHDRITKDNYQKNHGRHENDAKILMMLGTKNGTTLKQITQQLGTSEELAITHIVNLCRDSLVSSPHYMPGSDE